ncbi:lipase [Pterulicium gracile]|uniref:Lipase n=1 Tax=Pterulicium gracile TaxID=1884261 RepID=A0A5C3QK13_9AGAR|nr:lipase [Pterula gracilis]
MPRRLTIPLLIATISVSMLYTAFSSHQHTVEASIHTERRTDLVKRDAVPLPASQVPPPEIGEVRTLSAGQVAAIKPFTWYANAAWCPPAQTIDWSCGVNCDGNPKFIPTMAGGDGFDTQYWFVGWDPVLKTVVVGHEGTELVKIKPIVQDLRIILQPIDSVFFPGAPKEAKVHEGFLDAHEHSALEVHQWTRVTIKTWKAKEVMVVGHSLGASIALLSALSLRARLPAEVTVRYYGYGQPRTGNKEFADWVDKMFGGRDNDFVHRIGRGKDPIAVAPSQDLTYQHNTGELHISEGEIWHRCFGQENSDKRCLMGQVPSSNVLESDAKDHNGPFDGIRLGCNNTILLPE